MMKRLIACFALASFLAGFAAPALAQTEADRTTARELAYEGQEAFDRGDYVTAADRFARADALVHAPTLTLALARAQLKLGKVVLAYENYNRIVREGVPPGAPAVFTRAYEDAKAEVDQVRTRLAWVTIHVTGAARPRVSLDESDVPAAALGVRRAVDPGDHVVAASADGYLPAQTEFKASEGQTSEVKLELRVDPNAPAPVETAPDRAADQAMQPELAPDRGPGDAPRGQGQRTAGYVALGVGAAGLVVGAVGGVLAIQARGDLVDACPNDRCSAEQQETLDSYERWGTISTVGFIVSGVGVATGLTLLLTAPKAQTGGLSVRVASSGISMQGRF
jgi:hypothetical protein